jgi:hypothetical protein
MFISLKNRKGQQIFRRSQKYINERSFKDLKNKKNADLSKIFRRNLQNIYSPKNIQKNFKRKSAKIFIIDLH